MGEVGGWEDMKSDEEVRFLGPRGLIQPRGTQLLLPTPHPLCPRPAASSSVWA